MSTNQSTTTSLLNSKIVCYKAHIINSGLPRTCTVTTMYISEFVENEKKVKIL